MIDLIYKALSDDGATTAIVADRIFPEVRQQGSDLPALLIDLNGVSPVHTNKNRIKADDVEVTVTAFARGVGDCLALSKTAQSVLENMTGLYTMADGTEYTVAGAMVTGYDLDTDYDGEVCASEISFSFSVTY